MPTGMPSSDSDFDRPQYKDGGGTKAKGLSKELPGVDQGGTVQDGYSNPYGKDKGERPQKSPGGSKSNDGYDNMGINQDGPPGMGKGGYGNDRKNYGDKKGGSYK